MGNNFIDSFLATASPDDLRNIVLQLNNRLETLEKKFLRVESLGEITRALGDVEFRTTDDNGVVRTIMSAQNLFAEFGIHANLAGFDASGNPMFWISSDTGAATFLGGNAAVDNSGILITLAGPVIRSIVGARTGANVMDLLPGQTLYSYLMKYYNDGGGSELVTNGTFTTDLTGWTTTTQINGAWSALNGQARFDVSGPSPSGVLTQRIAISAGIRYLFSARGKGVNAGGYMAVKWYDAAGGGNLLRTDIVATINTAYPKFSNIYFSPAGAAGVDIILVVNSGVAGDYAAFDDVSLQVAGVSGLIGFEPSTGDPIASKNGVIGNLPVANRTMFNPPNAPTNTNTGGGLVDVGNHYYRVTFTDAYGETLPGAALLVTVSGGNKTVNLAALPVGPLGTLGRKIYRTIAGAADIPANYKLLTTIANNTALTYLDIIADASLGADAPTNNTTGCMPVYDRVSGIMGDEMLCSSGSLNLRFDALQRYGLRMSNGVTAANGDEFYGRVWLEPGTYTLNYLGFTQNINAKTDVYLDGALIASAIDWYSASGVYNVLKTQASVVVATPGYHHLRVKVNGRNAGNTTGWNVDTTKIWFMPAGF